LYAGTQVGISLHSPPFNHNWNWLSFSCLYYSPIKVDVKGFSGFHIFSNLFIFRKRNEGDWV